MQLITEDNVPRRCAVTARTKDPEGFIITGVVLSGVDPSVEVSVAGAKELGKLVGMVPKEVVQAYADKATELSDELAAVTLRLEQIEQLRELEQAVAA